MMCFYHENYFHFIVYYAIKSFFCFNTSTKSQTKLSFLAIFLTIARLKKSLDSIDVKQHQQILFKIYTASVICHRTLMISTALSGFFIYTTSYIPEPKQIYNVRSVGTRTVRNFPNTVKKALSYLAFNNTCRCNINMIYKKSVKKTDKPLFWTRISTLKFTFNTFRLSFNLSQAGT